MPDTSSATTVRKGQRTRAMTLQSAAELASTRGLEPLSIGELAAHTGMSKGGLIGHVGSKAELQLATIEHAPQIFIDAVVGPRAQGTGRARMRGRPGRAMRWIRLLPPRGVPRRLFLLRRHRRIQEPSGSRSRPHRSK